MKTTRRLFFYSTEYWAPLGLYCIYMNIPLSPPFNITLPSRLSVMFLLTRTHQSQFNTVMHCNEAAPFTVTKRIRLPPAHEYNSVFMLDEYFIKGFALITTTTVLCWICLVPSPGGGGGRGGAGQLVRKFSHFPVHVPSPTPSRHPRPAPRDFSPLGCAPNNQREISGNSAPLTRGGWHQRAPRWTTCQTRYLVRNHCTNITTNTLLRGHIPKSTPCRHHTVKITSNIFLRPRCQTRHIAGMILHTSHLTLSSGLTYQNRHIAFTLLYTHHIRHSTPAHMSDPTPH
jgi:hypothetical protein